MRVARLVSTLDDPHRSLNRPSQTKVNTNLAFVINGQEGVICCKDGNKKKSSILIEYATCKTYVLNYTAISPGQNHLFKYKYKIGLVSHAKSFPSSNEPMTVNN